MAQTTIGEALNISPDVLDKLAKAQGQIDNLASKTEHFINTVGPQFSRVMAQMALQASTTAGTIAHDFGTVIPNAINESMRKMQDSLKNLSGGNGKGGLAIPQASNLSVSVQLALDAGSLATMLSAAKSQIENGLKIKPIDIKVNDEWVRKIRAQITEVQRGLDSLHLPNLTTQVKANVNTGGSAPAQPTTVNPINSQAISNAQALNDALDKITRTFENLGTVVKTATDNLNALFQGANNNSAGLITKIADILQRLQSLSAEINSLRGSLQSVNSAVNIPVNPGTAKLPEVYKEITRAINAVNRESTAMDRRIQKAEDALRRYGTAAARLVSLMNSLATEQAKYQMELAQARRPSLDLKTVSDFARLATTQNELTASIRILRGEMAKLAPNTTEWKELNKLLQQNKKDLENIKRAMGDLKNAKSSVNALRQSFMNLRQTVLTVFSIGAIKNWLKEMVEVHAQMRLQNTALRAILQNKDEADRIFGQVQQLAMRSPFSIMQMTTYTKQLAAYRVESEKLVGTTKMLADVSAGLGVDMQRLILAYGQVKSANYLRATEVRQFTEAGLNIAGELATMYSEAEGRIVSVGEVMDRITKRAVSFGDVEEVFKRVTSAGGLFYDMQKKQSDSVYGQMQRIKDAYTMMLDSIGQGNGGAIQWVLTFIREAMAEWRKWAVVIKGAVVAFGLYKIAALGAAIANTSLMRSLIASATEIKVVKSLLTALTPAAGAARIAVKGLMHAFLTTGIGALVVGLGFVIEKLVGIAVAGDEVAESLARIKQEAQDESDAAVARYETLAKVVASSTTSLEERKEALDEINRVYGEYLPSQMRELDGIRAMKGAYDQATIAIRQHYMEVEKKNRVEFYGNEYQKQVQKWIKDNDTLLKGLGVTETEAAEIIDRVIKKAEEGGLKLSDVRREIKKAFADYIGWDDSVRGFTDIDDVYDAFQNLNAAVDSYELSLSGIMDKQDKVLNSFVEGLNKNFQLPSADIKDVFAKSLSEGAKKGFTEASQYVTLFQKNFMDEFGVAPSVGPQVQSVIQTWADMAQATGQYEFKFDALNQKQRQYYEGLVPKMEEQKNKFQEIIGSVDKLKEAYALLIEKKKELDAVGEGDEDSDKRAAAQQEYDQAIADIQNIYTEGLKIPAPDDSEILNALDMTSGEIATMCESAGMEAGNNFVDEFKRNFPVLTAAFQSMLEQWGIQIQKIPLPEAQQQMRNTLDKFEKDFNQRNLFKNIKITSITTAAEVQTQLKNMYQSYADAIESYTRAIQNNVDAAVASLWFLNGLTPDEFKTQQGATLKAAGAFGWTPKGNHKKGGRTRKGTEVDWWQKRKDLAKDMNAEYEKLLKYYTEAVAKEKIMASYATAVANTFKGTKWANVKNWVGFDKAATRDLLNQLVRTGRNISAKTKEAILADIGKLDVEIGINIQKEKLEDFKKTMDKIFDGRELTSYIEDLGINRGYIGMIPGAAYVKSTQEIRNLLEGWRRYYESEAGGSLGEELLKEYAKYEKKIESLEKKEAKKRLDNYIKYTKESMSERGKLVMKFYQEQNKILGSKELNAWTKHLALDGLRQKLAEDLQKKEWDDLRNGDFFISLFDDLETASVTSIDAMLERLEKMKGAWSTLDLKEVRSIIDYMNQLREAKTSRDPFGALRTSLKEVNDLMKENRTLTVVQDEVKANDEELERLRKEREELEKVIALRITQRNIDENITAPGLDKYKDMSTSELWAEYDKLTRIYADLSELREVKALRAMDGTTLTPDEVATMQKYSEWDDDRLNNEIARLGVFERESELVYQIAAAREYEASLTEEDLALRKKYANLEDKEIQAMIDKNSEDTKNAKKKSSATQTDLNKYKNLGKAIKQAADKWDEFMEHAKRAKDTVMSLLEVWGIEGDSIGAQFVDAGLQIAEAAFQMYLMRLQAKLLGAEIKTAMGPIGWILLALEAVVSITKAIFNASDKSKQKQIDAAKERVDELSRAYDKLADAIDKAYRIDDYKRNEQMAEANIQSRIRQYEEMIRLEKSRKNSNKEDLKEYRNNIEDLKKELEDLRNDQTKALGGFGSDGRIDAAKEFVDVWLDAYKETGDGLDALTDKWDDYIENLLKQQAAYRLVGRRMEVFFNKIDQMANEHSEYSMRQILEQIQEVEGDILSKANDELKEFFDYFGWDGSGSLLLSDLQKGIQNITEEQAAALESITNSIRFGVWRQVDLLTELVSTVRMQYGGGSNAILDEVRGIRRLLENVDSRLSSVIKTSGTSDGRPAIRIA